MRFLESTTVERKVSIARIERNGRRISRMGYVEEAGTDVSVEDGIGPYFVLRRLIRLTLMGSSENTTTVIEPRGPIGLKGGNVIEIASMVELYLVTSLYTGTVFMSFGISIMLASIHRIGALHVIRKSGG